MSLDLRTIYDAVLSHAARSGLFGQVKGHEVVSNPGNGLTFAAWIRDVNPASSGLDMTSALLALRIRIYYPVKTMPSDPGLSGEQDPELLAAVSTIIEQYVANVVLTGNGSAVPAGAVRMIDVRGSEGQGSLSADFGWLNMDDGVYRIADILLPIVINDLWAEAQ